MLVLLKIKVSLSTDFGLGSLGDMLMSCTDSNGMVEALILFESIVNSQCE